MLNNNRNVLRDKAYELRDQGLTWTAIGNELGVSRKVAKKLYEELNVVEAQWTPLKLESIGPLYTPKVEDNEIDYSRFQPMRYSGDAVVTCDWHVPLHDIHMVNGLFEKATQFQMDTLIIGGDFFNQDQTSSYHPHQKDAGLQVERAEAMKIMGAALEVFEQIYFIWGNHDYRFVKFMGHILDFEYSMKWLLEGLGEERLSRIHFSNLDHMIYNTGREDIYICHPENFSANPLTVARDLVPKYGMGVLTAHSHHFAQGMARDGRNRVFDGGGLFSPAKTEYVKRTNRHHKWVPGFHIFKEGLCYPFSPAYGNL